MVGVGAIAFEDVDGVITVEAEAPFKIEDNNELADGVTTLEVGGIASFDDDFKDARLALEGREL